VQTDTQPNIPVEQVDSGKVRILAALVNPVGEDQGQERIILANGGLTDVSLANCVLRDAGKHRLAIPAGAETIPAGASVTINLPKGSFALSNKGGEISLLDGQNKLLHRVSYSKAQANVEGRLIYF